LCLVHYSQTHVMNAERQSASKAGFAPTEHLRKVCFACLFVCVCMFVYLCECV
jgi:hypothetical protein